MHRLISRLLVLILTAAMMLPISTVVVRAHEAGAGIKFESRTVFTVTYNCGVGYPGYKPPEADYGPGVTVEVNGPLSDWAEFEFTGWRYNGPTTQNRNGAAIINGSVLSANTFFIMPEGDVTFTAQWTVKRCKVDFYINDGGLEAPYHTIFVVYGRSITGGKMPDGPSRPGFGFIGWSLERSNTLDESVRIATMSIREDIDVFAIWSIDEEPPEEIDEPDEESDEPEQEQTQEPTQEPTREQPQTTPDRTPGDQPQSDTAPPAQAAGRGTLPGLLRWPFWSFEPSVFPRPVPDPDSGVVSPASSPPASRPLVSEHISVHDLPDLLTVDKLTVEGPAPAGRKIIEFEDLPIPMIRFGEKGVLLFPPEGAEAWALLNLILAALGFIYALINIARALLRKRRIRKEYCDRGDEIRIEDLCEEEESMTVRLLRPSWLAASIILGILGALLFALTQDMSKMMVLIDIWTLAHMIIFAVELITVIFIFKKDNKRKKRKRRY